MDKGLNTERGSGIAASDYYPKCKRAGDVGSRENDSCRQIVDECANATSWPHVLVTDNGTFTAKSFNNCTLLARLLGGKGHRLSSAPHRKEDPRPAEATPAEAPAQPAAESAQKPKDDEESTGQSFADICSNATSWPHALVTDNGTFMARSFNNCTLLAKLLGRKGFAPQTTVKDATPQTPAPAVSRPASGGGWKKGVYNDVPSYCTEKTGYVPASRSEIKRVDGSPTLVVDGTPLTQNGDAIPILDRGVGKHDRNFIMLPYREVHFKLAEAESVEPGKFQKTVGTMIEDVKNVLSGPFSRVCGLHYLKEFKGGLTLYVVGKTDRLASEERNLELSIERAKRVAKELGAQSGDLANHLWVGGGNGLAIKYIGVGESMTETNDEVASPKDRRVELYLSTKSAPFAGDWVQVDTIKGRTPSASEVLDYYCEGADSDCKNLIEQCTDALPVMCEAVSDDGGDRKECERTVDRSWMKGSIDHSKISHWLDVGYLRFPYFYRDGGRTRTGYASSLRDCLKKAPEVADRYDVPRRLKSRVNMESVTDPTTTRGRLPKGTEFCTAEHGWMESSKTWVSATPVGELLWYGSERVGIIGSEIRTAKRNESRLGERAVMVTIPFRYAPVGRRSERNAISQILKEAKGFIEGDRFVRECMGGVNRREVLIEISYDPGRNGAGKVKSFLERLASALDEGISGFRSLFWDVSIVVERVRVNVPGFIFRVTTPMPVGRDSLDAEYSTPGHGRRGSGEERDVEVIPLK